MSLTHGTDAAARTGPSFVTTSAPDRVASEAKTRSYLEIFRTTVLLGGASVATIASGVVRTKIFAVLLGPSGVGLMSLYTAIGDVAYSVGGLGINSSGVRQIAEAVGSGDRDRIARTAAVLRRLSLVLGTAAALALVVGAGPIADLTFGTSGQATAVALLSLSVLFRIMSAGQGALLQGMRRIADLAAMNVIAAFAGTAVSIPIIFVWRDQGVAAALVVMAAITLTVSSWYCRRLSVSRPVLSFAEVSRDAADLLALGVAFMATACLTMLSGYLVRMIVLAHDGMAAAGLYQAAWALGGLYVGFILQAMGTDFYPRLTAVATDDASCNRLVNEQALVSWLLAGPGVIATLAFAPWVVSAFYARSFEGTVPVLRLICLGMMLRVVAWPMGFVIVAKGARGPFVLTELAAAIVQIGLAWLLVPLIGVSGAGLAFVGLYAWHTAIVYAIVRRMSAFRWSRENRAMAAVCFPLIGVAFAAPYLLKPSAALLAGAATVIVSAVHSAWALTRLLPSHALPQSVRSIVTRLAPRS